VTGGVPWYLEQIQTHQSADENIKRLCFEKNGSPKQGVISNYHCSRK
jgi:hypothetical protein